jgi:hypothetical protein
LITLYRQLFERAPRPLIDFFIRYAGSPLPTNAYLPPSFFASRAKAIASVWHSPTGTHVPFP